MNESVWYYFSALCENRSLSHECVFNDDETSPVKPGPTHHKSMEVLSGGFAVRLDQNVVNCVREVRWEMCF